MPRAKKYHTAEEKRNANQLKSKRSYEKLKNTINSRRRQKYRRSKRYDLKQAAETERLQWSNFRSTGDTSPVRSMSPTSAQVAHAQGIARLLADRLQSLTTGSTRRFLEHVCTNFELNRRENVVAAKDIINSHIVTFSTLQREVIEQQDRILQLASVGRAWQEVEGVLQRFRKVVGWLEDILCLAMIDPELLMTEFRGGDLLFQSEDTSLA